jgi:serine/threonine protein kinase
VLGGRYHLDRRIGCGAMATIYAATDQTTKGCVAVKVLHPEHDQSADLVRRFTQEGQLAAQIRHPNLVPANDLGWIGGRHYVVMQLVHGERLPALMQSKPLPWALSVRLVLDLLAGLAALHERGVAHRDVSPYNCMIEPGDDGPRARLLDLGNARVIEETSLVLTQPEASETMSVYGTSRYIAPERLQGEPGDFRADVFSVGALWYTMLTAKTLPDPLEVDPAGTAGQAAAAAPARGCACAGALDGRDRRHHSAASMAAAIRAALRDHTRRQAMRLRLWWLVACDRRLAAAGLARPAGAGPMPAPMRRRVPLPTPPPVRLAARRSLSGPWRSVSPMRRRSSSKIAAAAVGRARRCRAGPRRAAAVAHERAAWLTSPPRRLPTSSADTSAKPPSRASNCGPRWPGARRIRPHVSKIEYAPRQGNQDQRRAAVGRCRPVLWRGRARASRRHSAL